ncbi:FAD-dependent oxidoreductase [Absicoccus intestinalis]|uniref:FAD-dependent oxidoreductase n=1 Tax=Absicoccus intestinalis TaxID=2926319 RepID=A0ABU4WKK2_9FIRM|nr:FAD-dependent oxidoreductase [Absicoccus sp. CLA-KB-P134]MDX8417090.1 FAD-dependent oxidoreductase [Absicoccus sp. CLA-KB-P134]
MSKYEHLFSPVKIGKVEVPNRIALLPMGVFSPRLMNKDGSYTKDGADYYIERAKGGTGLIITGLVPLPKNAMASILNDPESYVKRQKYLADGIHKYGSKVFIMISALSGRSSTNPDDPAPSALPNVWNPKRNNREMTKAEIEEYIQGFAIGAKAAKDAGIDGVEIHAVHEGYLLDQFTIRNYNHRQDEYGGSLENRLRFPCEIVKAIKKECGEDFPVSIRYSVKSYTKGFNRGAVPGETFEEFGRDYEESFKVAKMLEEAGYDMLDCDNGTYDAWYWPHPPVYMPKALNLDDVAELRKHVNIPVICGGRFDDPALADQAIAQGRIDMMGMGRPLLADADRANKFKEGREDDIRPCISCHFGCLARIFQYDAKTHATKDISCALNPRCGMENHYNITPAETKKKVAVVGGGIAGMEAARVAALRGHLVDLYEKSDQLGGVFIAASAFEFKEDDRQLLQWYRKQIKDTGVHVLFHTEFKPEDRANYDEVFVATGAHERKLDTPGFDSPHVRYAIDALTHQNIKNQNVVIIGGGLTGCELAYDLARRNKKVTIVEALPEILNVEGLSAANYNCLKELLRFYHVDVLKYSTVKKYENGKAFVKTTSLNVPNINDRAMVMSLQGVHKTIQEIPADTIIVSVGYRADQDLYEQIKDEHVHLLGDAVHPGNLMSAIWGAYTTALHI